MKSCPWLWFAPGILLSGAAIGFSNTGIEAALGRSPGELQWGPALFRVLLGLHGLLLLAVGFTRLRAPRMSGGDRRQPVVSGPFPWGILTALTIIGAALRLWRLDTCLWLDEILTMVDFARPPLAHIVSSFPDQNQHMLFSIMAHNSVRMFGESAWALRLPSVLLGLASIWALFLLGRIILTRGEALLACTLMTFSYHHIWFSQNARGYMGLLFASILATWLWSEAQSRDSWRWWVGYAATIAAGMWFHMTMLFVVATHALITAAVLLWRRDFSRLWKPLLAFTLCATFTLQVFALTLPEFLRSARGEISMPSEWTQPLWVVAELLKGLRIGFSGMAVVFCGGFLVLAGWLSLFRRRPSLALAMVLPGLLGGVSMFALGHNLWPRFFFFCMGFALLVVIRGASVIPALLADWVRPLRSYRGIAAPAGIALAGLIIVASAATVPRCYALPKQDFTGARDFAVRIQAADEPIATTGLAAHAYGKYYAREWKIIRTAGEMAAFEQQNPRALLVYTLPIELKAFHPELWRKISASFEPIKIFPGTLGGGEVYVCRRIPAGPQGRPSAATAQLGRGAEIAR